VEPKGVVLPFQQKTASPVRVRAHSVVRIGSFKLICASERLHGENLLSRNSDTGQRRETTGGFKRQASISRSIPEARPHGPFIRERRDLNEGRFNTESNG
jgi:hypothetical protein